MASELDRQVTRRIHRDRASIAADRSRAAARGFQKPVAERRICAPPFSRPRRPW